MVLLLLSISDWVDHHLYPKSILFFYSNFSLFNKVDIQSNKLKKLLLEKL